MTEDNANSNRRKSNDIKNTKMENRGDNKPPRDRGENAPVAKDPSLTRDQLADPSEIPAGKKIPSDLPGAEMAGDLGTAARSAAGGTKGASSSSEGRKGDPENYGTDQTGPGLATGPVTTNPGADRKK